MYDNLDAAHRRAGLDRPVPRPAPAAHQHHPGVQPHPERRRLLAGQREEPAAAAHLRHRVGEQGRAQGLPGAAGRGRAPRPPPARRRAGPVQLPRRDRLRPGRLPPQGRRDQAGDGGLRPPLGTSRRASTTSAPRTSPRRGLFETSGHLPYYADTMFPADGAGEQRVLPQGHELPDAQPDLPVARAVLPRAAAAVLRVRLGLPVREVRRRARPHPRARADPGRLAQLRHPGAGARRDPAPAGLRARPAARLRPRRLLPGAVHPRRRPGQAASSSAPRRSGRSPPRCSRRRRRRPAWSSSPDPGGAAFYGPKISVQARDAIGRTWQMSTIQYDFNQPARFGLEYTAADGGRAAAGDDPLGEVRLDRAVLRRPHRALRRRLPGLAGARCRWSASRSPTSRCPT